MAKSRKRKFMMFGLPIISVLAFVAVGVMFKDQIMNLKSKILKK